MAIDKKLLAALEYYGYLGSSGGGEEPIDTSNKVFVILSMGQSNEVGTAESARLTMTTYPIVAPNVFIVNKTSFDTVDNVFIEPVQGGINMRSVPTGGNGDAAFGSSLIAANLLAQLVENPVYIINGARGGTALAPGLNPNGSWDPDEVGGCFDYVFDGLFTNGIGDIQALHPGKDIEIIVSWHQSEADNTDNTATTNYPANFTEFKAAVEAFDSLLVDRLWLITKPYYNLTANEDTINAFFDSLADSRTKIIDISTYHRRTDLTTDEKGGFAATGTMTDDNHNSYLQQVDKGEQQFTLIKSYFNIGGSITEDTSNTDTIESGAGIRLQLNRDNITRTESGINLNKITSVTNSLAVGAFSITGNARFKLASGKGWFSTVAADGSGGLVSTTNIGTTLFNHSFSFGGWYFPINARVQQFLVFDTQNIASNISRFNVLITASGEVQVLLVVDSTLCQCKTPVIWSTTKISRPYHIAVTVTSGDKIRIYINGALQTLTIVTGAGENISGLTLANYSNSLRPIQFGYRTTAGPTNTDFFYGLQREVKIKDVVWSAQDIANLMLN